MCTLKMSEPYIYVVLFFSADNINNLHYTHTMFYAILRKENTGPD